MSINDVIKKSFLQSFGNSFSRAGMLAMLIALAVALIFGLFICLVYNKCYRGVVYNRSFAITLAGMCVTTAMVTLAISSNVVISLGMVGVLSIVRYRTAIKEPLDLLYLFWSITSGIASGAQMYLLAAIAAAIMTVMLMLFNRRSSKGQLYIMIIHHNGEASYDEIRRMMANHRYRIKSRTMRGETGELALEVFLRNRNLAFAENLRFIDGVEDVTLIQYDGEYHE